MLFCAAGFNACGLLCVYLLVLFGCCGFVVCWAFVLCQMFGYVLGGALMVVVLVDGLRFG